MPGIACSRTLLCFCLLFSIPASAWLSLSSDPEQRAKELEAFVHKLQHELEKVKIFGSKIAQWLQHRTCDWKVAGSNPCRSGGRIFFSRVNFLFCADSYFGSPFHPCVTAVAPSAGGRLQLNMPTPYVCGFAWSDIVHGCMVYTELAPRWQQILVAPAMSAL